MATCVSRRSGVDPWETSADDLRYALGIAGEVPRSGKLRDNMASLIRTVIDARMLFDSAPFSHLLENRHGKRERSKQKPVMLDRLATRKDPEKLPESAVFCELVEIVFTRKAGR